MEKIVIFSFISQVVDFKPFMIKSPEVAFGEIV